MATILRGPFERTIDSLLRTVRHVARAERSATASGFLQRRDARAKIVSAVVLLIAASTTHHPAWIAGLLLAVIAIASTSRVRFLASLFAPVTLVAMALALPAIFVTPGRALLHLAPITVTVEGLQVALLLGLRVLTTAAIALLLVLSTPWPALLEGLRGLKIPATIVAIVAMTMRYIDLLLKSTCEMFVARRSRMLAPAGRAASRRIVMQTSGVLFAKTFDESQHVYDAMISRGFSGDVRTLDATKMRAADFILMIASVLLATFVAMGDRL
jgi:cobalt/nickel transport system permease protein